MKIVQIIYSPFPATKVRICATPLLNEIVPYLQVMSRSGLSYLTIFLRGHEVTQTTQTMNRKESYSNNLLIA